MADRLVVTYASILLERSQEEHRRSSVALQHDPAIWCAHAATYVDDPKSAHGEKQSAEDQKLTTEKRVEDEKQQNRQKWSAHNEQHAQRFRAFRLGGRAMARFDVRGSCHLSHRAAGKIQLS